MDELDETAKSEIIAEMKRNSKESRNAEQPILVEGIDQETKDGMIEYATQYGGQYKTSIIGRYIPLEAIEIFSDKAKLNKLLSSTCIGDVQEIMLVSLHMYGMEIIYISTSKQEEYAIPYSFRPEMLKITNGKLYTMQELINIISNAVSAQGVVSNEME